jgi:Secretion system C-terminal sorting domain
MKSVTNPLTIRWNIKPENKITYFLSKVSGNEESSISLSGSGSQVLSISKGSSIFIIAQAINPPPCDWQPDDPLSNGMSGQNSTGSIPGTYSLNECYPNPFNPTTKIDYALPQDAYVSLRVFNVLGQEVGRLVDEYQTAGYKSVEFDASRLPSGLYFYRLTAGNFVDMKKMMLLK